MAIRADRKPVFCILLSVMLSVSPSWNIIFAEAGTVSPTIELHDFYWNKSPLKVLVDMDEWGDSDYPIAVREALDNWVKSIWNYTHAYTNTTLAFSYMFYVSGMNSTSGYDILVSFSQNEIELNVVGLTTFKWDPRTHIPIAPTTINITSYSATADGLFITNVAMHELGHALGLGHANSPDTTNGPELMYPASSLKEVVYPSTLDIYGLLMLSSGNFGEIVSLPSNLPYVMLAEGHLSSQGQTFPRNIFNLLADELEAFFFDPQEILYDPVLLLVPSLFWMAIALVFGLLLRSEIKATMVSIGILVFAFIIALVNLDVLSLGLRIVLVLPSIVIGASLGGFIGNSIVKRKSETVNIEAE